VRRQEDLDGRLRPRFRELAGGAIGLTPRTTTRTMRRKNRISLCSMHMTKKHRIFAMSFASVYPLYVAKAEKKGRKKSEVDAVICWLTGYNQRELEGQLKKQKDFETFFKEAPRLNPSRTLIKGVVCGVRVEDIQDPMMRDIRYLDKLVDELAKGKAMDKILRA
jgi:hypothetical protein